MTGLDAHVVVRRDGFALDVALTAAPGEVVALVGPNGAGKSTVLRVLAGLQDGGRVHLDGADVSGLPPERRRTGLVPQDGLLLPHLSARDNVAYGLRARGVRAAPARARAGEELHRLGLADRADARPHALSGGQAQRVALARALATDPSLLLLDEPLAALDALVRADVRSDLRSRLAAFAGPTLLVTHDLVDALVLADRAVVLEDGRAVQSGAPAELAARPQTAYAAGLAGLVLLTGADGVVDGVRFATGLRGPVRVAFRPEDVRLHTAPVDRGWPVRVRALEQQGATTRVLLDGPPPLVAAVPATRLAELDLRADRVLWASVDAADAAVYEAARER